MAESINSKFNDVVGTGDGFVSPPYSVDDVPIVLSSTDKGVIVHEDVSSWLDGKEGTGDVKIDAVTYYTIEDFKEEHGDGFVTLDRYKNDLKGIEGVFQSAPNAPVADDAGVMKGRLVEINNDYKIYNDNLNAEIGVNQNINVLAL